MNLNAISAFYKCLLVSVCSDLSPLQRLNSHFPHTLIPFPSHGWSYSHSHGNPMGAMGSQPFPFLCICLVWTYVLSVGHFYQVY